MTVLYILDYGTVGGATKAFIDLAQLMRKKGVKPIVVTGNRDYLNDLLESEGIKTIDAGHYTAIQPIQPATGRLRYLRQAKIILLSSLRYYWGEIKAILKISNNIDMKTIDIIHTNSARNTLGCFLSILYKKPHILHIREFGDKDFDCIKLNPFYYSILNKFSTVCISVSQAVKRHWDAKGISQDKNICIYDGVNADDIVMASEKNSEKVQLHCVICGGVCEAKGQLLAVEAIGKLPSDVRNNISLDIIGWYNNEYLGKIVDAANDYGISHQICLCGAHKSVHKELQNYQIGLMCSRSEGFGLVTAEYMHAGLGVIASDSGACPELIEDGKTGLIFKSGNSDSLSEKLLMLINNRQLLKDLSAHARKAAQERFTCEINRDNILKVYKRILHK